jgi:hypothetical protein
MTKTGIGKLVFIGLMPEMQNAKCRMQNCGVFSENKFVRWRSRHNHSAFVQRWLRHKLKLETEGVGYVGP